MGVLCQDKKWGIYIAVTSEWGQFKDITGDYICGSTYGLTLAPATIPNSFSYQGGEWKTTVTSAGNWKLDETMPLPDWVCCTINPD